MGARRRGGPARRRQTVVAPPVALPDARWPIARGRAGPEAAGGRRDTRRALGRPRRAPPSSPATAQTYTRDLGPTPAPRRGCKTAWEVIAGNDQFKSFAAAARNDSALVALLSDPDAPVSVLVPVNDAFVELANDLDMSPRAMAADPLAPVVLRTHVLNLTARLADLYPAANVTNMLGGTVVLLSPSGVAKQAVAAPAPAPSAVAKPAREAGNRRRLAQATTVVSTPDGGADGGLGSFLAAVMGIVGSLASTGGTGNDTASASSPLGAMMGGSGGPMPMLFKPGRSCAGGCVSARDWRALSGGRNATVLAGNGRTCSGRVHAIDSVLLPQLLSQEKAGRGAVFVVGDGAATGAPASTVTVGGPGDVTVVLAKAGGGKAKKQAPAAAAPAPASARQPVPAPARADAAPPPAPAVAGATVAPRGAKPAPAAAAAPAGGVPA